MDDAMRRLGAVNDAIFLGGVYLGIESSKEDDAAG